MTIPNHNESGDSQVTKRVMQKIEGGSVTIHSPWAERIHRGGPYIVLVLSTVVVVYMASLLVFEVLETRLLWLPGFGFRGIQTMVRAWPWVLMLILIVAMVLVERLGRTYLPTYRQPIIMSLGLLSLLVGGMAWGIAQTPFHSNISAHVPPLYRHRMQLPPSATIGRITTLTLEGFTMRVVEPDEEEDDRSVRITSDTRFREHRDRITPGQLVMVIGEIDQGEVVARGVRLFSEVNSLHHRQMMRRRVPMMLLK